MNTQLGARENVQIMVMNSGCGVQPDEGLLRPRHRLAIGVCGTMHTYDCTKDNPEERTLVC